MKEIRKFWEKFFGFIKEFTNVDRIYFGNFTDTLGNIGEYFDKNIKEDNRIIIWKDIQAHEKCRYFEEILLRGNLNEI